MHLFQLSRSKGTEVLKLQRLVHAPPSSNKSKKKSSKNQRVLRCIRCLWLIYRGNHHHHENLKSKLLGRRCHAMKICTGGRPALFTVTRGLVKRRRVTLSSIQRTRAECDVSGRTAEKFVSIAIRKDLGVNSIEAGLHVEMGKMNHVFDNLMGILVGTN